MVIENRERLVALSIRATAKAKRHPDSSHHSTHYTRAILNKLSVSTDQGVSLPESNSDDWEAQDVPACIGF